MLTKKRVLVSRASTSTSGCKEEESAKSSDHYLPTTTNASFSFQVERANVIKKKEYIYIYFLLVSTKLKCLQVLICFLCKQVGCNQFATITMTTCLSWQLEQASVSESIVINQRPTILVGRVKQTRFTLTPENKPNHHFSSLFLVLAKPKIATFLP